MLYMYVWCSKLLAYYFFVLFCSVLGYLGREKRNVTRNEKEGRKKIRSASRVK